MSEIGKYTYPGRNAGPLTGQTHDGGVGVTKKDLSDAQVRYIFKYAASGSTAAVVIFITSIGHYSGDLKSDPGNFTGSASLNQI